MTHNDTLARINYMAVDIRNTPANAALAEQLAQEMIDLIKIATPPIIYPPKESKG